MQEQLLGILSCGYYVTLNKYLQGYIMELEIQTGEDSFDSMEFSAPSLEEVINIAYTMLKEQEGTDIF